MQTAKNLDRFTFNANGLTFFFIENGKTTTLSLDPFASCNLMKIAGLIEGFDMDKNNEPVILFTEQRNYPEGYGFEFWCLFVCSFKISFREAQMLLEAKEETESFRKQHKIINDLLAQAI